MGRRKALRALAGGLVASATLTAVAAGAQQPLAGIRLPAVEAVAGSLPHVDVAPVLPAVTAPPVQLVGVQLPGIQSPSVQLPPAPSLPPAPDLPAPQTPSVPGAPTVPSTPVVPSTPAVPGTASSPAVSSQPAGDAPTAEPGAGSQPAAASPAPASHAERTSGAGPNAGARAHRRTTSSPRASVAHTIARLKGCLSQVAPGQRRVLELRGGLGPGPSLSASQVARRLALEPADEARIERRGLHRLAALDRDGTCARRTSGSAAAGRATWAPLAPLTALADRTALSGTTGAAGGVAGVSASGGRTDRGGASVSLPVEDPGVVVALLLLAAALGVLVLAVRRELRQR